MALTDPASPSAPPSSSHAPKDEPFLPRQARIVGALIIREMNTRFGRDGLGFVWVVMEPLAFCFGVLIMWSLIKPEYEHGVRLAPFVMSGYMSLILMRHFISQFTNALQANVGLMHHRQIAPVHFYMARGSLEFLGTTAAFVVVYVILLAIGQVDPPKDYLSIYIGWMTMAWVGSGFALILAGLAMKFEMMERLIQVISYILVPASGAFMMVAWIPSAYRDTFLLLPFAHGIELIRHGIFGEFVATYYDIPYAWMVATVMNIVGLLLVASGRGEIDVD